jgi:predicted membrane protein
MDNDINNIEHPTSPNKGKVFIGIILLALGASLLLKQFNYIGFPHWLFGFPMWLIGIGLYIGAKNNFRKLSWLIMVVIGVAFLLDDIMPNVDVSAFFWPIVIIGFGVFLILRRNNNHLDYWDKKAWKRKWDSGKYNFKDPNPYANTTEPIVDYKVNTDEPGDTQTPPSPGPSFTGDEHLDAVSVFGSVKKTIFSKNFQGGEIVNVMGGAEIDFTQANINGRVYIDITQIFGGTKIIVPSHWMVVSDIAAVFAGVDDKRIRTTAPLDSTKVLVLKGVSIFAGIDIRSY